MDTSTPPRNCQYVDAIDPKSNSLGCNIDHATSVSPTALWSTALCFVRAFLLCHGRGQGNPLHWGLQVHTQQACFDFCCLQQVCGATCLEVCIPALPPTPAPASALLLISLHSWPSYPHRTVLPASDSPRHSAFYLSCT